MVIRHSSEAVTSGGNFNPNLILEMLLTVKIRKKYRKKSPDDHHMNVKNWLNTIDLWLVR